MSGFTSSLRYLYGLQARGMKFGLENIGRLVSISGNPHEKFRSVHIAGTNGKGSTAAMLAAMLTAAGYTTGLYTSPHLVRFPERIRVNGKQITEQQIAHYLQFFKKEIEQSGATFFEATTAIAFRYFADMKVDIAVIEAGLGGRLDATNVITPEMTLITSIGLEHTDILGNTRANIAREKSGIIKPNVPCLIGNVHEIELEIFQQIARRCTALLTYVPKVTKANAIAHSLEGLVLNIRTPSTTYENVVCSLSGDFQIQNAAMALTAAEELKKRGFSRLNRSSFTRGLAHVQAYTGLRGRLEVVSRKPLVIVDVAHNPDALRSVVGTLRKICPGKMVVLFGVMKDKDALSMIRALMEIGRIAVAAAPRINRALEPEKIVDMFHGMGGRCLKSHDLRDAKKLVIDEARNGEAILVTGSHYIVGEFLEETGW